MSEREKPILLVVDDMADTRTLMRLTLGRSGWDVHEAKDGSEAIHASLTIKPDLILMDYQMPEVDGLEACGKIKSNPETAHIPIIIFTGAFSGGTLANQLQKRAFELGASEFLVKPILPTDLQSTVRRVYEESKG
ncbi:MAG TPA: response regulator [Aggregatilineales bacterium]|nr:response regulator [Aggregatilineales bacterium]